MGIGGLRGNHPRHVHLTRPIPLELAAQFPTKPCVGHDDVRRLKAGQVEGLARSRARDAVLCERVTP